MRNIQAFRRALILGYLTCTENLIQLAEDREVRARGFVKFFPKKGYGKLHFRPIVNILNKRCVFKIKTNTKNYFYFEFIRNRNHFKAISRTILQTARENCITKTTNLYMNWRRYTDIVLNKEIFGVKVDVIDAFGNINISNRTALDHIFNSRR